MHTTITISDPDRNVDYLLAVVCDVLSGSPPRFGWQDGGEPGEPPAVEINRIRCLEMAVWCGKCAVSAYPAADGRESLESRIGAWCLDRYREEIEQALNGARREIGDRGDIADRVIRIADVGHRGR